MVTIPWRVDYHDGSGNHVVFWQERPDEAEFEYIPIQPKHSSSGVYSGGQPQQGRLTAARVQQLWLQLSTLPKDTTQHVTKRMKGTGAFRLQEGPRVTQFLLGDGSALREFHAMVKQLLKENEPDATD